LPSFFSTPGGLNYSSLVFLIRLERNTWERLIRHTSNLVPGTWWWREEVKNEFYMKLNIFCNTQVITILLIVACIVIYVWSNHVVYSLVVVWFLYLAYKFTICVVSSRFVSFCIFLFSVVYLYQFLLFINIYVEM
jgi:hypothetical protein